MFSTIYDQDVSCLRNSLYHCSFLLSSFSDVWFIFMWKVCFYIYSPICVCFFRRIESRFFAPKSQILRINFSILQRYRFRTKIMEDLLNIVEEPSQIWIMLFLVFLTTKSYLRKIIPPSCNLIMLKWARGFLQVQLFFYFFVCIFQPVLTAFFGILGAKDKFFFFFQRLLFLDLLLRMSMKMPMLLLWPKVPQRMQESNN